MIEANDKMPGNTTTDKNKVIKNSLKIKLNVKENHKKMFSLREGKTIPPTEVNLFKRFMLLC